MIAALQILHWIAGMVVLAEALNKLERMRPFIRGFQMESLGAIGWFLLALGAGGAVITPMLLSLGVKPYTHTILMRLERPTLAEVTVLLGLSVLMVRARLKESALVPNRRIGDHL